ncbi:MAG TPA: beta/gamma crystallin-related protein [Rhizomicrobium sp.]
MTRTAWILSAAAGLALVAVPAAAAPRITLYSAPNYQGTSVTIDHPVRDLDRRGMDFGDRAQSARVHGRWLMCAAKNFEGDCVTLNHDTPRLKNYDMNRRADSVRPL